MSSRPKTGLMIIKPGKLSYKILQWMQTHEKDLKRTTGHQLAEKIVELPDIESGEVTVEQTLSKMVLTEVLYRDKYDKSIYSDFRINYWHKSIPSDILADAPVEVKRAMAKTIDNMKPNQYMDDAGCVVTPNAVEKTEDPFSENDTTTPEPIEEPTEEQIDTDDMPAPIEEPVIISRAEPVDISETETTTKPAEQEVSVPVEIKKDGKSMSITINLTINL